MRYLLGIDLGSSSVKVALVEAGSGRCVATASSPDSEAPIKALQPGWAEQRPEDWWRYFKAALAKLKGLDDVAAVGISYQMHGLVCLDKELRPLRDAIIWCDSRGVPYGQKAFDGVGREQCLRHLLNAPGNFTATKLAWVKEHEPRLFETIRYVMLPGDWLALRLSGTAATTACGLSEMMLWDFEKADVADFMMDYLGFSKDILPPLVPTFGEQGRVSAAAAAELGLPAGIPITYRAGDQPNNALSLGVLNPGEVAATAGTSGVVYGVADGAPADGGHGRLRLNTFLHVNRRLGRMHCINGCGILNAWMRRTVAPDLGYEEMNCRAAAVPAGSEGVCIIPFGNGAERVLENRETGCVVHGVNFNRHGQAHLLRAAQEGIAFALYYGMELMGDMKVVRAGKANMFLSPLFRQTLAGVSGATIELYDTDGAVGAARAAGGLDALVAQAAHLAPLSVDEPSASLADRYREAYARWKEVLTRI